MCAPGKFQLHTLHFTLSLYLYENRDTPCRNVNAQKRQEVSRKCQGKWDSTIVILILGNSNQAAPKRPPGQEVYICRHSLSTGYILNEKYVHINASFVSKMCWDFVWNNDLTWEQHKAQTKRCMKHTWWTIADSGAGSSNPRSVISCFQPAALLSGRLVDIKRAKNDDHPRKWACQIQDRVLEQHFKHRD